MAELGMLSRSDAHRVELDEASLALLVVDDDCRCLDATDDAVRLLGVTHDEILGATLEELLAEEARERFAHIWRAFREVGGHAGPFRVDSGAAPAVDLNVASEVLPSRHLVILSPDEHRAHHGARATGLRENVPPSALAALREGHAAPSSRERQILGMLAAGATDGQIAERLRLSPATVRTHVRNAKAKLGASTRAQAVAVALQRRVIEPG